MTKRFSYVAAVVVCAACILFAPAAQAGTLPLRPRALHPEPKQRGLDEIHELPEREAACPVCGYMASVPLADSLMRRPPGHVGDLKWQMHAASRDSDLCPYPGPGKLSHQADIVICPSCGYAREEERFGDPVPPEAIAWVLSNLRPSLREAEKTLVGNRRNDMNEDELVAHFNRQERIPDTIRTEHFRTFLAAIHAAPAERARACLLAAWAARRETAAPPRGAFLAKHAAVATAELAKAKRSAPGLHGDITAMQGVLRRMRQKNRDALPGADHMAGRLLLAGMWDRFGFLDEAETLLQELYHECRERFLRPEQDPLWPATSTRASRTHRLNELEIIRADAENEALMRLEMVRRERELLTAGADRLREAFRAGAFDADPEEARFHAYMTAECLRRAGSLPLAAEWFKNLIGVAKPESDLRRAAEEQLEFVGEEAGDKVNLLSAFGQDGELFDRLRRICAQ